jgi:hypothetical protein
MDTINSLAQHPLYFKVVILSDCVNGTQDVSEALLVCLPCFSKHRGEHAEQDIRSANRMTELANAYGWYVVFESKNEREAFEIQCRLRRNGLRILPFGHPLPFTPIRTGESDMSEKQDQDPKARVVCE